MFRDSDLFRIWCFDSRISAVPLPVPQFVEFIFVQPVVVRQFVENSNADLFKQGVVGETPVVVASRRQNAFPVDGHDVGQVPRMHDAPLGDGDTREQAAQLIAAPGSGAVHHFRGRVVLHVKRDLLFGYELADLAAGQQGLIATPEKALLDLVYLDSGPNLPAYLHGLRLQNLDSLELARLTEYAVRFPGTKLPQVTGLVAELAQRESEEFEEL